MCRRRRRRFCSCCCCCCCCCCWWWWWVDSYKSLLAIKIFLNAHWWLWHRHWWWWWEWWRWRLMVMTKKEIITPTNAHRHNIDWKWIRCGRWKYHGRRQRQLTDSMAIKWRRETCPNVIGSWLMTYWWRQGFHVTQQEKDGGTSETNCFHRRGVVMWKWSKWRFVEIYGSLWKFIMEFGSL